MSPGLSCSVRLDFDFILHLPQTTLQGNFNTATVTNKINLISKFRPLFASETDNDL